MPKYLFLLSVHVIAKLLLLSRYYHYLHELIQISSFVSERIPGQAVREWDKTVRKVVLRQPGNYCLLLHIRSRSNVNNEVTQFLPMPIKINKEIILNNVLIFRRLNINGIIFVASYLTTSTAPAQTFGSFPLTDLLAAKEPSMLKTTHSVLGGITAIKKSTDVWSPLRNINRY